MLLTQQLSGLQFPKASKPNTSKLARFFPSKPKINPKSAGDGFAVER
ncbi:hypothetical protein [Methylomonas albis]|nr:hypothetical protein [Methylomonas albis]